MSCGLVLIIRNVFSVCIYFVFTPYNITLKVRQHRVVLEPHDIFHVFDKATSFSMVKSTSQILQVGPIKTKACSG